MILISQFNIISKYYVHFFHNKKKYCERSSVSILAIFFCMIIPYSASITDHVTGFRDDY